MKKKILIILAVIACIIAALVGYSAYEVHQSAQEFQKAYESKKSFERTETDEAEADGEKKAEEQSGDRPYGVIEPGSEYEVDTYIDNRDNSNRLYIYDMDYMDLALDFKPKKLADFIDVINENSKIARKFKPIDNAEPLKITAKKNGKPLTKEQWENATVELGTVNEQGDTFALDWDIQKGSEVSTWIAIPKYKDGKMFETDTGKAEVTVDVSTEIDGNSYGKAQTVSMKIKDDRGVLDYLKHYWKQIALGLLLLILILGYIPPFKKRFPRKMKSRPSIECTAEKIGIRDSIVKGNFEKNKLSVFLPYKAEVGRLTFSPAPVKKTARVKAAGGGSMMILNTSTFAGKEDTTFNGMSIPDNYKGHYRISASTIIVVATPEFTYTCIPNVQRTADGSIKKGKRK